MRIRFPITFLLLVFTVLFCHAQTIIPGGYVSGNWDASGNPYIVEGPITIHRDSALEISEGVIVEFYDSAFLLVNGYISAMGIAGDSIVFKSAQNTWKGIRMGVQDSTYQNNHLFYYCIFRDAHSNISPGGGAFFVMNRDDVSIFNSTFTNNFSAYNGGAIYLDSASIQLKNINFISNSTAEQPDVYRGGAMFVTGSQMIFENFLFDDNHSVIAGALYSDWTSLELRNSDFIGNTSTAGGGAWVSHNSGLYGITNCLFQNNRAGGSGGAIALLEMITARFKNCTIRENVAKSDVFYADGGGVLITPYDNVVSFVNCVISDNSAGDFGGGVYAGNKTDLISCLLTNNVANTAEINDAGGGAIYMYDSQYTILNCTFHGNTGGMGTTILNEDADLGLVNTIIWDDSIGTNAKIFLSEIEELPSIHISNSNIIGGQGVIRGSGDYEVYWGNGNIDVDPLFEVPGTDFRLSNESPCIDTGRIDTLQLSIPATDLDGNPRIYRDVIDMGCYENQTAFSVQEISEYHDIVLYPNPARDIFYLENNSQSELNGDLQIIDLQGRKMLTKFIQLYPGSATQINLPNLPGGMYLVSLVGEDVISTFKLLIQD